MCKQIVMKKSIRTSDQTTNLSDLTETTPTSSITMNAEKQPLCYHSESLSEETSLQCMTLSAQAQNFPPAAVCH